MTTRRSSIYGLADPEIAKKYPASFSPCAEQQGDEPSGRAPEKFRV